MRPAEAVDVIAMRSHDPSLSFVAAPRNMIYSAGSATKYNVDNEPDLTTPGGRLTWARIRAGYHSKIEFAARVRINPVTYRAYEGNQNGFAKHAALFARKLGVSVHWLLEGEGQPDEEWSPDLFSAEIASIVLDVLFQHECGVHVPEDILRDYAKVLHAVCVEAAEGGIVAADAQEVRLKAHAALNMLHRQARLTAER